MIIEKTFEDMDSKYEQYLEDHLMNVRRAFEWIVSNAIEVLSDVEIDIVRENIEYHDSSKFSPIEWEPYAEYFYGERTPEVEASFEYAWLHHIHTNPHHWQHWLLREDDGATKALLMPKENVVEMICDWWAFSFAKGDLNEIFNWYELNKSKQVLHPDTRARVENILDILKSKVGVYPLE